MFIAGLGACGALARYGVQIAMTRLAPGPFPWGTLIVNVVGCFLFGLVLSENRLMLSTETRFILTVGFLGAFTTFSSFAFDTVLLAKHQDFALVAVNILAQNALGIAFLLAGWRLGRLL